MNDSRHHSSREIAVSLRGVTKTFDSFLSRALAEATLEIRRGEVFGLIGPARSGKSTTLRLVAGRLRPTEGVIRVFGRRPWRGASRRRIGYVPEKGRAETGRNRGWLAWLAGWFASMSGGGARTDLKQALLGGRDLVILDEPFVELDEAGRRELRELIRMLKGQGRTVVFSSALLTDAREICDRVAIYAEGKIRDVGTLEEIIQRPETIGYLVPVLGEPAVNQFSRILEIEVLGRGERSPSLKPEPAPPPSGSNQVLASLTKSDPAIPASTPAPPPADSVNHEKLNELAKPPGTAGKNPDRPSGS